jgi:uncharacterized membrane protein
MKPLKLKKKEKKPSKFKEKVKNFFKVDMDELTKEEEPVKVFEKTPLIKLTRNKIFLAIALFLIIVNVLVGFNINYFYIRAILGFIFLITVPGLLIMLCFKIRTVKFWEFLVYTIGLSIAFIMFAGLAVNWTLPALNITDKPLSLYPILICFNIFLIILGIVGWKRNKDFTPVQITVPKLDLINNIFFIIPMAFPVLAILGAFLLNNHGSNILTMILLGSIAVYVLLLTIFRKRLNENIYPWALWLVSVSLLFTGWLRSWFVSGPDISLEYWIFQFTKENAFWGLSNLNNAYNAMLSVNIFPTILSNVIQMNDQFIFKLIMPLIFSIISLIIYLISKRILFNILCFFSGLLFLSLPDFLNWCSIPIRQEIAFIFFGLTLLILSEKKFNPLLKKSLFLIFGATMIISHYSTSYIALAIFSLTYIINLFCKCYENKKIKKDKSKQIQKLNFYLTGTLILLLLLFGFLWYSQITPTANGLINFVSKSISNLGNIFNEDIRQGGATDPIFGFFNKQKTGDFIEEYKNQTLKYDLSNKTEGFSKEIYSYYKMNYLSSKNLNSITNLLNLFTVNYYLKQIISKIFQLFILLGFLYIIFYKDIKKDTINIFIGTILILSSFLFLPFFSIDYDLTRFIQQILIILAPLSILGSVIFFKKLKLNFLIGISCLLIILIILFSGFSSQIIGGDEAKLQLNNFGKDYDTHYMFYSDFFGADWLNKNSLNLKVYADASARLKINSYAGRLIGASTDTKLLPNMISRKSYVYFSTINSIKNMGFFSVKGLRLGFNLPTEFLNENKNKVYNNGGSEIFK